MKLFTVQDSASETYLPPFCMDTTRDAMQGLKVMVNSEQENKYSQFPEDFTLLEIGLFDNRNGHISLYDTPMIVINASKLKEDK